VGRCRNALESLGADTAAPDWLAPARAVDIPFAGLNPCQAVAAAAAKLGAQPVDIVAQPLADRRKMLLVADMDSTFVIGETLDELAAFAGLRERIAAITARSNNGKVEFAKALRDRVRLMKGLPADALEQAWRRVSPMPGARTLIATMKAHGAFTVLVSGSLAFFTARVKELCGFDRAVANQIEVADGHLTGAVCEPILDRGAKLRALLTVAAERKIVMSRTLAVGDGANDIEMIRAAGLGVAFHARPIVAVEAQACIDHSDLTALLFLQGYREEEFVA